MNLPLCRAYLLGMVVNPGLCSWGPKEYANKVYLNQLPVVGQVWFTHGVLRFISSQFVPAESGLRPDIACLTVSRNTAAGAFIVLRYDRQNH